MGPKKDKGKKVLSYDSQALVLKPESNVPKSHVSSLDLANRFSPFSNDQLVSYSNTLISPYDPFVDASKKSRVPGIDFKKPSAYLTFPLSQHLFSIELNRSPTLSAGELALSYFPPGFHWIPEDSSKNLAYYSNILLQIKSVHISPIFCKTTVPKKINYHSVYLNTPIPKKNWGDHPLQAKNSMELIPQFFIMIILMLGLSFSCFNLLIWIIRGSSVLIEIIVEEFFLSGLINGGLILAFSLNVFPFHSLIHSTCSKVVSRLINMVQNSL